MDLILVEIRKNYAIIWLMKEPVNILGMDLWTELKQKFDDLEVDKTVRGVIFASGLKRDVFTAGNDINAPRTSEQQYIQFWILSNHILAQVYKSRLATISAIKGACPAGGCVLSMCCDERIMTPKGYIGLNEVALGIEVPKFWTKLLVNTVGYSKAEKMCLNALLLSPQEALSHGLVNQIVAREELLDAAEGRMQQMLSLDDYSRAVTKQHIRADFCKEWEEYAAMHEPRLAWKHLNSPNMIKTLDAYMKSMGGRTAKL